MNWFSIVTEQFWFDYNDLYDKRRPIYTINEDRFKLYKQITRSKCSKCLRNLLKYYFYLFHP